MVAMQGKLFRPAFLVAMAVSALLATSPAASALSFDDIAGRWCGDFGSYIFSREQLVVHFNNDAPTRRYSIDEYDYGNESIKVIWRDHNDKRVHTWFGDFRDRGQRMSQLPDPQYKLPRRELRRC